MNRKLAVALMPVLAVVSLFSMASPASAQEEPPTLIGLINGSGLLGIITGPGIPSLIGFIGFDAGLGGVILPSSTNGASTASSDSVAPVGGSPVGGFGLGALPSVNSAGTGDLDLDQVLGSGVGIPSLSQLTGQSLINDSSTREVTNPISEEDNRTGAMTLIPVLGGLLALYVTMMRVVRRRGGLVLA